GQTAEELRDQGRRIDELNATFRAEGSTFRVLRSIEMDVFDAGEGDMDPAVLAELDLVLGAFHSKLRRTEDATERYLAALRNPSVHVLAHPTTRMFGRRAGLVADCHGCSPRRRVSAKPSRSTRPRGGRIFPSTWRALRSPKGWSGSRWGVTRITSRSCGTFRSGWRSPHSPASLVNGSSRTVPRTRSSRGRPRSRPVVVHETSMGGLAVTARSRRSAGILLWRRRDGHLEVLLGHPGGPLFARKDADTWSVLKGEIEPGEDPLHVARREFEEETGHPAPDVDALELG